MTETKSELTGLEAAKADAAARDASVLGGVTRESATETTGTKPKAPARRSRTAKPTDVNGEVLPARTPKDGTAPEKPARAARTTKRAPKPGVTKTVPAPSEPAKPALSGKAIRSRARGEKASQDPKPEANGEAPATASARLSKRAIARRVATVLAREFKDEPLEVRERVAYWIHGLPYGGADESNPNAGGAGRWFPEELPRPTTADWR